MKISHRKKRKQEFKDFISESSCFSISEKQKIQRVFECRQIQVIFKLTMYLFLWSFCAAFVDTFLVTRGIWFSVDGNSILANFLPTFVFLVINASLKFTFIYFYTRKKIPVRIWHIFLGVIPMIGSLFITMILLRRQKLFFRALQKFLKYKKKKRLEFLEKIKLS